MIGIKEEYKKEGGILADTILSESEGYYIGKVLCYTTVFKI